MAVQNFINEVERYGKKKFDLKVSYSEKNRRIIGYEYDGFYCQIEKENGRIIDFDCKIYLTTFWSEFIKLHNELNSTDSLPDEAM